MSEQCTQGRKTPRKNPNPSKIVYIPAAPQFDLDECKEDPWSNTESVQQTLPHTPVKISASSEVTPPKHPVNAKTSAARTRFYSRTGRKQETNTAHQFTETGQQDNLCMVIIQQSKQGNNTHSVKNDNPTAETQIGKTQCQQSASPQVAQTSSKQDKSKQSSSQSAGPAVKRGSKSAYAKQNSLCYGNSNVEQSPGKVVSRTAAHTKHGSASKAKVQKSPAKSGSPKKGLTKSTLKQSSSLHVKKLQSTCKNPTGVTLPRRAKGTSTDKSPLKLSTEGNLSPQEDLGHSGIKESVKTDIKRVVCQKQKSPSETKRSETCTKAEKHQGKKQHEAKPTTNRGKAVKNSKLCYKDNTKVTRAPSKSSACSKITVKPDVHVGENADIAIHSESTVPHGGKRSSDFERKEGNYLSVSVPVDRKVLKSAASSKATKKTERGKPAHQQIQGSRFSRRLKSKMADSGQSIPDPKEGDSDIVMEESDSQKVPQEAQPGIADVMDTDGQIGSPETGNEVDNMCKLRDVTELEKSQTVETVGDICVDKDLPAEKVSETPSQQENSTQNIIAESSVCHGKGVENSVRDETVTDQVETSARTSGIRSSKKKPAVSTAGHKGNEKGTNKKHGLMAHSSEQDTSEKKLQGAVSKVKSQQTEPVCKSSAVPGSAVKTSMTDSHIKDRSENERSELNSKSDDESSCKGSESETKTGKSGVTGHDVCEIKGISTAVLDSEAASSKTNMQCETGDDLDDAGSEKKVSDSDDFDDKKKVGVKTDLADDQGSKSPEQVTPAGEHVSPEYLKQLSETLCSLNRDSARLTTDIHKRETTPQNPEESVMSTPTCTEPKQTIKRKRSLDLGVTDQEEAEKGTAKKKRKKNIMNVCVKEEKEWSPSPGTSQEEEPANQEAVTGDSDEWESCDSDNPLEILDPTDPKAMEIDKLLDERAEKTGLSVFNVKTILKEVVSNELVWQMVQNTVNSDEKVCEGSAPYEPKMTRLRLKQALEKDGGEQYDPASPVKKPSGPAKEKDIINLMEMSFSDNEDDEDYEPGKEEVESDNESESNLSSLAGEADSPRPSTPTTPLSFKMDSNSGMSPVIPMGSPMGPPPPPQSRKRKLVDAFSELEGEGMLSIAEIMEEETIALRTRSKLPLVDKPLDEIEAAFVAPDITPDMYKMTCYDNDWQEFLRSLTKSNENDQEDENSDPEYDFLGEVQEETPDKEDFRTDKAVNVTKKELSDLLEELLNEYEDMDQEEEDANSQSSQSETVQPALPAHTTSASFNVPRPLPVWPEPIFTRKLKDLVEERARFKPCFVLQQGDAITTDLDVSHVNQICNQMRAHVQLLAQMIVLTKDNPQYQSATSFCHKLLEELQCYGQSHPGISLFHPCNLQGALNLAKTSTFEKDDDTSGDKVEENRMIKYKVDFRRGYNLPRLTPGQMEVFSTDRTFIFPSMLPEGQLIPVEVNAQRKVFFTEGEDRLLALGLEQCSSQTQMMQQYNLIHTYMMPPKTPKQLRLRVKNLRSSRSQNNPVIYLKQHGKTLECPRWTDLIPEDQIMKPEDQPDKMPEWFKSLQKLRNPENPTPKGKAKREKTATVSRPSSVESCDLGHSPEPIKTPPPPHISAFVPTVTEGFGGSGISHFIVTTPNQKPTLGPQVLLTPSAGPVHQDVASPIIIQQSESGVLESIAMVTAGSAPVAVPEISLTSDCVANGLSTIVPLDNNNTNVIIMPTSAADTNTQNTQAGPPSGSFMSSNNQVVQEAKDILAAAIAVIGPVGMTPQKTSTPNVTLPSPVQRENTVVPSPVLPETPLQAPRDQTEPPSPAVMKAGAQVTETGGTDDVPHSSGLDSLPSLGEGMGNVPHSVEGMEGVPHSGGTLSDSVTPSDSLPPRPSPVVIMSDEQLNEFAAQVLFSPESPLSKPGTPVCSVSVQPENIKSRHENQISTNITESHTELLAQSHEQHESPTGQTDVNMISQGEPLTTNANAGDLGGTLISSGVDIGTDISSDNADITDIISGANSNFSAEVKAVSPSSLHLTCSETTLSSNPDTDSQKSNTEPYSKQAYEIIASVIHCLTSPSKVNENADGASPAGQKVLHTPKKYRHMLPKPMNSSPSKISPIKLSTPANLRCLSHSPRKSPRRQFLQQQARAIKPKGLVIQAGISPTKKAAASITARVKRSWLSPRKIFPKPPTGITKVFTSPVSDKPDLSEYDTQDSEYVSEDTQSESEKEPRTPTAKAAGKGRKTKRCHRRRQTVKKVEDAFDAETEVCDADSQEEEDEEDHLQQLMKASTTIKFNPERPENVDSRGKRKKKDMIMDMLAADLVESDPLRDERDTAFAQSYLARVKTLMKTDQQTYGQFLKLLKDFGSGDKFQSPVTLYHDLKVILSDYPELLTDFAVFLLPQQAEECGCLSTNQEFHKAREFLRKLEVNFSKRPTHYQSVLKAFAQWEKQPEKTAQALKDLVVPLLKGQPHLLQEFSLFFADEKPPESHMHHFEEITLSSDDEKNEHYFDGYEEVEIPDSSEDLYGTQWCKCDCHQHDLEKWRMKKRHCMSCGLKVIKGRLYVQTTEKNIKPMQVVYFNRPKKPRQESGPASPLIDGQENDLELLNKLGEKENLNVSPKSGLRLKKKKLKVKVSSKKLQAQGQFLNIGDVAEEQNSDDGGSMTKPSVSVGSPVVTPSPLPTIFEDAYLTPDSTGFTSESEPIPKDFSVLREEIQKDKLDTDSSKTKTVVKIETVIKTEPSLGSAPEGSTEEDNSDTRSSPEQLPQSDCKETSNAPPSERTLQEDESMSDSLGNNCNVSQDMQDNAGAQQERIVLRINLSERMKMMSDNCSTSQSVAEDSSMGGSESMMTDSTAGESNQGAPEAEDSSSTLLEPQNSSREHQSLDIDSSSSSSLTWTRDEDREILESCKSNGPSDITFSQVAGKLQNKTPSQVSNRFRKLMKLFTEQDTTDGESDLE